MHRRLEHPHVVRLIDFFEDGDHVYLVLELCEHGSLYRYMRREYPAVAAGAESRAVARVAAPDAAEGGCGKLAHLRAATAEEAAAFAGARHAWALRQGQLAPDSQNFSIKRTPKRTPRSGSVRHV